jgi:hypothetical protein
VLLLVSLMSLCCFFCCITNHILASPGHFVLTGLYYCRPCIERQSRDLRKSKMSNLSSSVMPKALHGACSFARLCCRKQLWQVHSRVILLHASTSTSGSTSGNN